MAASDALTAPAVIEIDPMGEVVTVAYGDTQPRYLEASTPLYEATKKKFMAAWWAAKPKV